MWLMTCLFVFSSSEHISGSKVDFICIFSLCATDIFMKLFVVYLICLSFNFIVFFFPWARTFQRMWNLQGLTDVTLIDERNTNRLADNLQQSYQGNLVKVKSTFICIKNESGRFISPAPFDLNHKIKYIAMKNHYISFTWFSKISTSG